MSIGGVPTLLTHLRLSAATTSLRRQSETARIEVVTGKLSDAKLALGADVGAASLLRRALDGIAANRTAIARADLRLGAVQSVIGELSKGAEALNANLLSAIGRGDEATIAIIGVEAKAAFDNAFSRLNIRAEGRSLFAGDAVDQPALVGGDQLLSDVAQIFANAPDAAQLDADLDFYFNDPAGGFESQIYNGGAGSASALSIAEGETVTGDVKANDPAFKDLLRGLALMSAASAAPSSQYRNDALKAAGAAAFKGSIALTTIGARLGLEQQQISAADARLDAEETALSAAYNAKVGVDPYEAASRLQSLEIQLEAAYLLTSRLSQLSLTRYL